MRRKFVNGRIYEYANHDIDVCDGCAAWPFNEDRNTLMCEALGCGVEDAGPYRDVTPIRTRPIIGPIGSGKSESTLREMLYRAGVLDSPFAPMCSVNVETGECVVLDGERERIKRMTDELEAREKEVTP